MSPKQKSKKSSSFISPSLPDDIRGLYDADLRPNSIRTMLDLAGDLVDELIQLREKLPDIERASAEKAWDECREDFYEAHKQDRDEPWSYLSDNPYLEEK